MLVGMGWFEWAARFMKSLSNSLWRALHRLVPWGCLLSLGCLLGSCVTATPEEQARNEKIGVLVLHGKKGSPSEGAVVSLIATLRGQGYMISAPGFPWSNGRYIDRGIEQTFDEIADDINKLRAKGATKVILVGQSMGTNMALSYAAYRGGVQGLVLVSPGHVPESGGARSRDKESLERAREMVAQGRGNEKALFTDSEQGSVFQSRMSARIYLDFFDPNGKAAMSKSAAMLDRKIPVLYIVGTADGMYQRGKGFIYGKFQENPLNRYLVVNAGHIGAAAAADRDIVDWLNCLQ